MKKICFMIPSLNSGGSERVFLNLLNNLDRNKYDINLLLINGKGTLYPMLKKDIHIIELECMRVRFSCFNIISTLKKLKPDIVISTISEFNFFIGFFVIPFLKKYNIYFIGRESHLLSMTYSSKIKKYFKSIALNQFNKIIVQSDDMYKDIQENFNINKSKCIKINNPIDINDIFNKVNNCLKPIEYDDNYKILLCVARLYKQKGLDLLIPIMEQLKNYKVKLYIIGEGPEEENLKNLILEKKLEDRVLFLGRKSNPYIYMKYADLFLLSSRYEGFPNALIEAGSLGLYSICNSCKGGINEIIIDNFNGCITDYCSVERVKGLILKALFEMDINHDKIKEYTIKKYSINSIMALYCDTFNFEKRIKE